MRDGLFLTHISLYGTPDSLRGSQASRLPFRSRKLEAVKPSGGDPPGRFGAGYNEATRPARGSEEREQDPLLPLFSALSWIFHGKSPPGDGICSCETAENPVYYIGISAAISRLRELAIP